VDFHLIEKRRLADLRSNPVETFQHQRSARQSRAGDEE
jgi:hypothetical protein